MESYVLPLVTVSIVIAIVTIIAPARLHVTSFRMLLLVCIATLWWHGAWVFLFLSDSETEAKTIARIGHVGILFLPVAYRLYYKSLFGIERHERWMPFLYIALVTLLLTTDFIVAGVERHPWGFYPVAGPLHSAFIVFVGFVLLRCFVDGALTLRTESDPLKVRVIRVGLVGCAVFVLGSYDFLVNYGVISTYPFGFLSSIAFIIINAYGLIQFDLFKQAAKIRTVEETSKILEATVSSQDKDIVALRATVIHREKLATLGMLSAGVAHQLGNTLNVISTSAIVIDRMFKRDAINATSLRECIDRIKDSLNLSKDIIASLNSIGRENDSFRMNSLRRIVDAAVILTKGKALESVAIRNEVHPDLELHCSSSSLTQVFMNLFSNAVDAMSRSNGTVTATAYREGSGPVIVKVSDNGSGIPEGVRDRVFEAFVTSKDETKGTGLGLYLVKREIDLHGGKIWFDSDENGTRFFIELPTREDLKWQQSS